MTIHLDKLAGVYHTIEYRLQSVLCMSCKTKNENPVTTCFCSVSLIIESCARKDLSLRNKPIQNRWLI